MELSAPSLKLMQNIFPSSVQYNTTVSGNNRPKEGILLIDDDRQRLERTQSLLRKHFIVYSVNNDDEALDFLDHSIKNVNKDNEICLILISIDISGDHINGWGFLNMLWSTDELRAIPVIALTSSLSLELAKTKIWEVTFMTLVEVLLLLEIYIITYCSFLTSPPFILHITYYCRKGFLTLKNDPSKLFIIHLMMKHTKQTG